MPASRSSLVRMMPSWVEPDPLRSRAVDALGLQITADRIADDLLPGLSVLTTRARYYTLLAWARRECGPRPDETRIHRLEVALAIRESLIGKTDTDHKETCRFIGSRNLGRRPELLSDIPRDPRRVYRVPAWRAYRASMISLGFLNGDHSLTDAGSRAAGAFTAACRPDASGSQMLPPRACLSRCSLGEADLLAAQLGVWKRGPPDRSGSEAARRGDLWREIHHRFDDGFSVSDILENYEANRDRNPSSTVGALREAAIWERLSVGLTAVFLLWLHALEPNRRSAVSKILNRSRRGRGSVQRLEEFAIDDPNLGGVAKRAFSSIRLALHYRNRLGPLAISRSDSRAFDLGEALVGGREPIREVLQRLEFRHIEVKGDDAWLRAGPRELELARDPGAPWELPRTARLHAYRLWAFGQIIADLKEARR